MIHARRLSHIALLAVLLLPVVGCSNGEEAALDDGTTLYTVARGDLVVDVSASGNLSFATEENLAFDMAGTVEDIFVEVGDSVTDGQVVATLDTADWEERLRSLKMSVLSARRSLKQAEYTLDDMKCTTATTITGDYIIQDTDDEEIELQEMEVENARLRLEDAEANLDEHLAQSPEVVAPFDGFVTRVDAEGGDEVMKGSIAVTIADPNLFEVGILVSENDIARIVEGMKAEVTVDVMSITLPAEVTYIAPTATVSSGVVNYEVTIQVATLDEYAAQLETQMSAAQQQMAQGQQQAASGEMPDQLKQAVESGQMTEQEAQSIMERMQSGGGSRQGAVSGSMPFAASMLEGIELREGLSVTVTLIVADKSGVLLVPNSAINTAIGRPFVTVVKEDDSEERREVVTGVSNWQYTEIVDGLAEGELIRSGATAGAAGLPSGPVGHPGGVVMVPGGRQG